MQNYVCGKCGWVYRPKDGAPEQGIRPGTAFDDLPKHFQCAKCGIGKSSHHWVPQAERRLENDYE